MRRLILHPLTLALLLAVLVRILPATWSYVIGGDEALYLTLASHIAAGDGFTADGVRPHSEFDPGYPIVAALVYRITGGLPIAATTTAAEVGWMELPARLNILVLGSLLVVPVYFLARALRAADPEFAARAAFLTASVPALALGVPNFEAASEQLYALAIWTGWMGVWLGLRDWQLGWFLVGGLAFGVAHLTRWEGLVSAGMALVVTLAWLVFARRNSAQTGARTPTLARGGLCATALLVGLLVLAAPYAVYQTARTGSVFSTKSIVHQLHGEALASSDPYAWEKSYDNYERVRDNPGLYPPLPVYLWEHREQTAVNYVRNTLTQLRLVATSPTFLFLLWLPFAVIGAFKFERARNLFLAATLVPALVFPLSVVDGRYLLPLIPAGMLWAAAGLGPADAWVSRQSTRSRLPQYVRAYILSILLIGVFVLADLTAIFFIPRPTEYRTAGLALRGVLPAQAPVLMRRRPLAFYANVAYQSLPFSDLAGVLDYARQKGAKYFIVDARTTPATRPQLVYLLDELSGLPLEIAYEQANPRVIVYHIP